MHLSRNQVKVQHRNRLTENCSPTQKSTNIGKLTTIISTFYCRARTNGHLWTITAKGSVCEGSHRNWDWSDGAFEGHRDREESEHGNTPWRCRASPNANAQTNPAKISGGDRLPAHRTANHREKSSAHPKNNPAALPIAQTKLILIKPPFIVQKSLTNITQ